QGCDLNGQRLIFSFLVQQLEIIDHHQRAAWSGLKRFYDVLRADGIGTIEGKEFIELFRLYLNSLETFQDMRFCIFQREENRWFAGLHDLHGELQRHERFTLTRPCAEQYEIALLQPACKFGSGRFRSVARSQQAPGTITLLP